MRVGPAQYAEAYAEAAAAVGEKRAAAGLAALLARQGKKGLLPEILEALESRAARERGELSISITTASPLGAKAKEAVEAKAKALFPEAKVLRLAYETDGSLLGGFRIDGPEVRYDATAAKSLSDLTRRISQ